MKYVNAVETYDDNPYIHKHIKLWLEGDLTGDSFKPVTSLPTASENTMSQIYVVPGTSDKSDAYVTLDKGVSANPRFVWSKISGTGTDIELVELDAEDIDDIWDSIFE